MADAGHEFADAAVDAFLAEVAETYRQAEADAARTLRRFLARFEEQDASKRAEMADGKLSKADYAAWRKSRMLVGRRHTSVLDQVARAYSHANEVAMAALSGRLPEVYAENANFAAFEVCRESGLDLSFDLVDADTVQHMLVSGEAVLPAPSVNVPKDMAWNRRLVASQLTQGVLLGESIPKMAERVRRVTDSNYATAVRAARTAVTGAENAGRVASYKRAQGMGIDVGQEWLATLDGRTRHSHRQLDGERVEAGGTFSNGCRYPGDPEAAYAETMNCRCTLVPVVAGIDQSDAYRWSRLPEGVTYEQWKAGADRRAVMEAGRNDPPKGAVSFSPKYEVDERAVSSKAYAANVRRIFGDKAAGGAIASARRILRHRGGSNGEDLYAIDLETGRVVSSVVTSGMASRVDPTGKFLDRIARAQARGARIATLHNHPASGMPSASDLAALDLSGSEFGAIACHDGSFYVYRRVSEPIEGYNIRDEKRFLTVAGLWGDDEASLFRAIEERYGVRIEHIR